MVFGDATAGLGRGLEGQAGRRDDGAPCPAQGPPAGDMPAREYERERETAGRRASSP